MALPVKCKDAHVPDAREVRDGESCSSFSFKVYFLLFFCLLVLVEGLKKNFMVASVDVVTCPDLTQAPWHLAAPGKRHSNHE